MCLFIWWWWYTGTIMSLYLYSSYCILAHTHARELYMHVRAWFYVNWGFQLSGTEFDHQWTVASYNFIFPLLLLDVLHYMFSWQWGVHVWHSQLFKVRLRSYHCVFVQPFMACCMNSFNTGYTAVFALKSCAAWQNWLLWVNTGFIKLIIYIDSYNIIIWMCFKIQKFFFPLLQFVCAFFFGQKCVVSCFYYLVL